MVCLVLVLEDCRVG